MRSTLTLSELAEAGGSTPSNLSADERRGHLPIAPPTGNTRGTGRMIAPTDCLATLIDLALRRLQPSNRKLCEIAAKAGKAARQNLEEMLAGQRRFAGTLMIAVHPDGREERMLLEREQDRRNIGRFIERTSANVTLLDLQPIFDCLQAALCKANGLPAPPKGPPPLSGPGVTEAEDHGRVERVQAADMPGVTGLFVGPEEFGLYLGGEGLRLRMTPALWRDLAERAERLADELEGESPRSAASWAFQHAPVAGNA